MSPLTLTGISINMEVSHIVTNNFGNIPPIFHFYNAQGTNTGNMAVNVGFLCKYAEEKQAKRICGILNGAKQIVHQKLQKSKNITQNHKKIMEHKNGTIHCSSLDILLVSN
jgi:hypothetical protein